MATSGTLERKGSHNQENVDTWYVGDPDIEKYPSSQDRLVDKNMQFQDQGVGFRPPPQQHRPLNKEVSPLIRYLLFVFNLLFFMCACVLLGVGIWIAVDRSFMATITGNPLYAVAAYIIIAGGCIMFVVSFVGCCGVMTGHKLMLYVFCATMLFIFIILFVGAILAIVFRTQLTESIQDTMEETLIKNYGVDLGDDFNRAVTKAWDKAQEKLWCCAVLTNGWTVYQKSKWFELQPWNPEKQKPYVPKSCCVQDRFDRYINLRGCQNWRLGPPAQPLGGKNRHIYYQGCYDAGVSFVRDNSDILTGLGISFALLMIAGIVLSFLYIRQLPSY